MQFKQFSNSLYGKATGCDIKTQTLCYDYTVAETTDGKVFVNRELTDFTSLEEAVSNIKQDKIQEDIQREIQLELYEEMSDNKVADIIRKHHTDIKITDTLIESYVELASSKLFTSDPVAQDIRKFNKLDRLVEGHFDYKLNDGTTIVISESAQQQLNNIFGKHQDVIEYMRESQENFLSVLNQVEE